MGQIIFTLFADWGGAHGVDVGDGGIVTIGVEVGVVGIGVVQDEFSGFKITAISAHSSGYGDVACHVKIVLSDDICIPDAALRL